MAEQTPSEGEALRVLRDKAGLTLKEVANGAGTSTAYLSKVETNKLHPTQEYLAKVALYIAETMLGRAA